MNMQLFPNLSNLYEIKPEIYWCDFLFSAGLGWSALIISIVYPFGSVVCIFALVFAICAFNRAVAFTHEISHHGNQLPGFEVSWNWLVGFLLLVPSFIYGPVHLEHHRRATYGTKGDPSYLRFSQSRVLIIVYLLHTLVAPLLLVIRFFLLAPIGFFSPQVENWVIKHASAITINPSYRRKVSAPLIRAARRDSVCLLIFWLALISLGTFIVNVTFIHPVILLRAVVLWYVVLTSINLLEAIRTLAEHSYKGSGAPMGKERQIADSNDFPFGILTELWAPVGLRYHATHHALPGIPYYSLPNAYRTMIRTFPENYAGMTRSGLCVTISDLYRGASSESEAISS
jgi:fatty acid desaturase